MDHHLRTKYTSIPNDRLVHDTHHVAGRLLQLSHSVCFFGDKDEYELVHNVGHSLTKPCLFDEKRQRVIPKQLIKKSHGPQATTSNKRKTNFIAS